MFTFMVLSLALTTSEPADRHVRSTDPKILALLDAGISGSATFRNLIATLDESDVIVYIGLNRTRPALGGYLPHDVVAQGRYRYLRIAVETAGSEGRLVPLLAHELQHAIEVVHAPHVRDSQSMGRLFSDLALQFGCGGTSCLETQAARNIENVVRKEFSARRSPGQQHPIRVTLRWSLTTARYGSSAGPLATRMG